MSVEDILAEIKRIYHIEERKEGDVDRWQLADALGMHPKATEYKIKQIVKDHPDLYETLIVYDPLKRAKVRVLRRKA